MSKKFTHQQEKFVEEYLVDLNGKQAAIRAGYSPKSAKVTASRLLTNANVIEAIQKERDRDSRKTGITRQKVLKELGRLAFLDLREFFDEEGNLKQVKDLSDDAVAALAGVDISTDYLTKGDDKAFSITKKIKVTRKEKALEMLSKHLGLFDDKLTVDLSTQTLNDFLEKLPPDLRELVTQGLIAKAESGSD